MDVFNRILQEYIVNNSSNSFNDSDAGVARILVKGIPFDIAEGFVKMVIDQKGLLINNRVVPVFLCDDRINSWEEPGSDIAGVCGKDHILNLRNSITVNDIIVLLGEGSSLDKSNTTSFIPIGVDEERQGEDWVEQDMVQFFLHKALEGGALPFQKERNREVILKVLKDFKPGNAHQGEHKDQWKFLQAISEIGNTGTLPRLKAFMGLIKSEEPSEFFLGKCESIFSKIGDAFENSGVRKTVEEWLEKDLDKQAQDALVSFKEHFSSINDSISSFKNSPFYYYSSLFWNPGENGWWEILTIEKWTEILEETEELEGSCDIQVSNALFRNNKPCPVVLNEVIFKISHPKKFHLGETIRVFKKIRGYEEIDQVDINDTSHVQYECIPGPHKTYAFYQFRIEGYNQSTQKVISLTSFEPGFVFDIAQIEKVTPLKLSKRKNSKNKTWNSNLVLSNSGSHELNFYWDIERFEFKEGFFKESSPEDAPKSSLNPSLEEGKGTAIFGIEDQCEVFITFINKENGSLNKVILNVATNELEAVGVTSIYDKLVTQNKSTKGLNEKVSVNPSWNNLHQVQDWIIKNPGKSFYPILLGTDFKKDFKKPNWDDKALLTSSDLNLDCRPPIGDFSPPTSLVKTRKKIIEIIIENEGKGQDSLQPLIEYRALYTQKLGEELSQLVLDYLSGYQEWFETDPKNASWFDIIAINNVQDNVLDNDPFAILLNPFHPLRLGWQFQAQKILYHTLEENIPCPAAGIFESSQFPDSFSLPCYRTQLNVDHKTFLSIDGDSTYWGILWNSEKLGELRDEKITGLFDKTFGLQIQGLDEGLSSSQVEHTLSDIFRIKPGQNSINVEVFSESTETKRFNEGVGNWVSNNLGDYKIINNRKEVRDIWFLSGSRKLNIYDSRKLHFQPSAEELVDMTSDSGYNLKWHHGDHKRWNNNLDLTIISHLSNQSPALIKGQTSSVIFNGGISRERIRYASINNLEKLSFTESRVYSEKNPGIHQDELGSALSNLIFSLENNVTGSRFTHLNTTPQLKLVENKLERADYCAISSSAVDPSAFFDSKGKNLLWDYELPSYSKKQSSQSGFYLLAKKSGTILSAVNKSLRAIPGMGNVKNEVVDGLLKEISGRGIPTLKTLASGGASANGEIGMLTAMQLLQNFDKDDKSFEFFPVRKGNKFNLLVPVDPFSSQLNALYSSLGIDKLRPDLLAFSFCVVAGEINGIKITPVEIKYRNSKMNTQQLKSALEQCHNFTKFYEKLQERSVKSVMWDIARCRLLTDMVSFSFATYGRRLSNHDEKVEWAALQSKLVNALNLHNKIKVSTYGRLLVVSDWKLTEFEKVFSNDIDDVLKISFEDAKDLLLKQNQPGFHKLGHLVGDWGLMCSCEDINVESEIKEANPAGRDVKEEENELSTPLVGNIKPGSPSNPGQELEPGNSPTRDSLGNREDNPGIAGGPIPVPEELGEGIKFPVGEKEGALKNIEYSFHPSNTNLNQLNIGIVGDLGTGKTQLIKALLYNITKDPRENRGETPKFLIMDTKRDYDGSGDKESDKNFVKSIKAKIVKPHNLPINLFNISNSKGGHPALSKAEFFIDILSKIFGGIGPNQEHHILSAVIECFEDNGYQPYQEDYTGFNSPTLNDIFSKYEEKIGNKKDVPFSIMYKLVLGRYFEPDPSKTIDFEDFFNQSVVISLGSIAGNDKNLKMVMIFFLNIYREYMLGVKKSEYLDSNGYQLRKIDSYLLIDEANLIMEYELPVLQDILLKGREFGIGIILSSQYLSHFKKSGTNYMEPLLTWFVHKVPNVSVRELGALGLTQVDEGMVNKIKNLECHYCLYKGLGSPGTIIKGIPHYLLDMKDNSKG